MTLITEVELQSASKSSRTHRPSRCTCKVVSIHGENFLQLDTYGSSEREVKNTVSQTMQFNKQAIQQLKQIIQKSGL